MMKHPLLASLLATTVLLAAGCGTGPTAGFQGLRPADVTAHNGGWSKPRSLVDINTINGFDLIDQPEWGHPFAAPLKFRLRNKGKDGRVIEMFAPENDRPSRAIGLLEVDEADGAFEYTKTVGGKKETRLAKQVSVNFAWATNTAVPLQRTAITAQAIFVVNYDTGARDGEDPIIGQVALGYAHVNRTVANQFETGRIYPPINQQPLTIQVDSETFIPLRLITVATGDGLGQPCSDEAFQKMQLKPHTADTFVADVHSAFPQTWMDRAVPPPTEENVIDGDIPPPAANAPAPAAPTGPVPTENRRLLGIGYVGFGANVPVGTCSQALLGGDVTFKRWIE